ncbi:MAG TPA: hypothetical protein VIF43_01555 [Patescibacteria group bacterium]|jgi:uncharacterized protein YecA (UPF0149 family)
MASEETTGRRPERPRGELTEAELNELLARDMTAEVAGLVERWTADEVNEARERTQRVELDLDDRLPYPRWAPEVFFLSAENAMARCRAYGVGHGATLEQPMVQSRYQRARETAVELLGVITDPEKTHSPRWSDRSRAEAFPAVMAAIEDPERRSAVTARAFNLAMETAVLQEALSDHSSRWVEDMKDFHEKFSEWKEKLAAAVELTAEDEALVDQRLTLLAMVTKARSVVGEVAPDLQRLLVENLPQRGSYPEGFLEKVKDLLAGRMQPVVDAGNELEEMRV